MSEKVISEPDRERRNAAIVEMYASDAQLRGEPYVVLLHIDEAGSIVNQYGWSREASMELLLRLLPQPRLDRGQVEEE